MKGSPTDRGYVVIDSTSGGKSTVFVAASVSKTGRPTEVSAVHTDVSNLAIGSEVQLAAAASRQWSDRIVDVFDDGRGTVHIQGPWKHARSLDKFVS